jgi:hypothetical protein
MERRKTGRECDMTFDIWKGPGGAIGKPTSGDFADGSNWSTGAAPSGVSVNAFMGAGKYSVTLTSASYTIGSLTVGSGVTFNLNGPGSSAASLGLNADSINSGVISNLGSVLGIATGVTLLNLGTIYGVGSDVWVAQISGGTLQNAGLISTNGGPAFGDLAIFSEIINDSGGVISTVGGGKTALLGNLTNNGLVAAVDGGLLTFSSLGYAGGSTNFVDGVLTGGAWSSVGLGSTLEFHGFVLKEIQAGAVVTLSGAGSQIRTTDGNGFVDIETSLIQIGDGATFIIKDRDYTTPRDLDVYGRLVVEGGVLTSNGMTIHDNTGCALTGYGVVDAGSFDIYGGVKAIRNVGKQTLDLHGDAQIYGILSGPGTLEFSSGEIDLMSGARVQSKSILISGAVVFLDTDLIYSNRLTMTDGSIDTEGHLLRLKGVVNLGGGAEFSMGPVLLQFEGASVRINTGGATIHTALRNEGSVNVAEGSLTQSGAVRGVGDFTIQGAAKLTFEAYVGAGQHVTLSGPRALLDLRDPGTFNGTVADFGARETIHLEGFETFGAKLSFKADDGGGGGVLKLTNATDVVSFHLDGDYAKSGFDLADDGSGGANLTYAPATGATADLGDHLEAFAPDYDAWVV